MVRKIKIREESVNDKMNLAQSRARRILASKFSFFSSFIIFSAIDQKSFLGMLISWSLRHLPDY